MPSSLSERSTHAKLLFIIAAGILILKAFYLQVWDDSYSMIADATIKGEYTLYPARGAILDRNGHALVNNTPMYDLLVTYGQIDPQMDTMAFCNLLGISKDYFEKTLDKNWKSIRWDKRVPFLFLSKIAPEIYTRFEENLYRFPGFRGRLRSVRSYPYPYAAHVLGYINEVRPKQLKDSADVRDNQFVPTYSLGDFIGASGLEKQYEYYLRGKKGVRHVLKNNRGKEVGKYQKGKLDIPPEAGENLYTTLDIELQKYAEELMQNKSGSIVAIEPSTGEILTMVSAPTYDPALLALGKGRGKAYARLSTDKNKPFINRAIYSTYPPGSLFKPIVALIGLQEHTLLPDRRVECNGGFYYNGIRYTGCHFHPTCTSVSMGLQHSCNAYFVTVFREIIDQYSYTSANKGLDKFNSYLDQFGLGRRLGLDFPGEKRGSYPTSKYFDEVYKKEKRWYSFWIRSLGIGQGELLLTNIQMANLAAIIANRGHYYTPHLVKQRINEDGETNIMNAFTEPHNIGIDKAYYTPVIDGMELAVRSGTAVAASVWGIDICGKTGTAENTQGSKKDHSIFMAFAPKDDPKIAIVVYVENAGFGGTYAAPIASLLIEKYLKGEISPQRKWLEKRMLNAVLIDTTTVIPAE